MYKKLEDDQATNVAASNKPETDCNCPCGAEALDADKGEPEVNKAIVFLPTHYDINGGKPS